MHWLRFGSIVAELFYDKSFMGGKFKKKFWEISCQLPTVWISISRLFSLLKFIKYVSPIINIFKRFKVLTYYHPSRKKIEVFKITFFICNVINRLDAKLL